MYEEIFKLQEQAFKALANSKRLEIIHLLRDQEMCVSSIHSMLDLPQANISQHLMVLKDAQLVTTRKKGKQVFYQLAHSNIIKSSDLIRETIIDTNPKLKLTKLQKINMKKLVPLVHDPICSMRLSPKTASFSTKHNDKDFYFCASGCLKIFQKDPQKYV